MTDTISTDRLIEQLTGELTPVRPLQMWFGLALTGAVLALTIAVVLGWLGLRSELLAGQASAIFVIANGLILLLGLAAAATVVRMGSPQVGNRHEGWKWALAMASLLPLAALVRLVTNWHELPEIVSSPAGPDCLIHALVLSGFAATALILWLRKGAPVSPPRAGMLAGIAASALGTFAYGLACPVETIYHLGVWHCLPMAAGAVIGRIAGPRVLGW
jgi:hypothetical protein